MIIDLLHDNGLNFSGRESDLFANQLIFTGL
jgi:hypothetical protein